MDSRFIHLPKKRVTIDDIRDHITSEGAKRIHFATSHKNSLTSPKSGSHGKITLPFRETIEHLLLKELREFGQNYLFPSKFDNGGYWRGFKSHEDYELCQSFVEKYQQIVFLRDTLDLSLALSMNLQDEKTYTDLGELEYEAKYQHNKAAESQLVSITGEWLQKLPYYSIADSLCAMPCSQPGQHSLPRRIVDGLGHYDNISAGVRWLNKNLSLKELRTVDEKLEALENFGLEITSDLAGKNVILLDDLYMSGLSMQFVAMKLKEAGADRVFGISIVKARSNTAL